MNGRKAIAVIAATGAQRLGTEVVNADIDNSESLKSIRTRLRGLLHNLFHELQAARPLTDKVKVLTVAIGLPAQLPRRLRVPVPHPR